MGQCVEKIACDDCGGTSKQTFWDLEKERFYAICFGGCGNKFSLNPYGNEPDAGPTFTPKTPEEIFQEVQDARECPAWPTKYRGIPAASIAKWGVRQALSDQDGKTPYAFYFPYGDFETDELIGWKAGTIIGKNFWSIGDTKPAGLFGLARALKIGGPKLYITEGEWDCIALEYMLKASHKGTKFEKREYAVVSIPKGSGEADLAFSKNYDRVKHRFKEFIFCFDNDEAGKAAIKKVQKVYPKMLMADMPAGANDPNEALTMGLIKPMVQSVMWDAHTPPLKGMVSVADCRAQAMEKPVMGLSYPWPELTDLVYGQRFGEAICLGGGVGSGKTVTAHEMMAWNIRVHGYKCFAALLEERNGDTVRNIAAKVDSVCYSNPKIEYDEDNYNLTVDSLDGNLILWDSEGDDELRFDMDEIIASIRFVVAQYGVKFAYIDNWTRLVDCMEPSDANSFINKYASKIESLAAELDIHIMTYSHLNSPKHGASHEEGAPIYPNQFTGSRGIMRCFPVLMSFRRNKHAEDGKKNNSLLGIIKNRKYGNEGEVRTQYGPTTGRLLETCWEGELMNEKKGKRD